MTTPPTTSTADGFKPLLAGKAPADLSKLRYPVLASPKLDGIRCLTLPNDDLRKRCRAVSRTLKPIPNNYVRNWIEENVPPGIDGELMLSDWTAPFKEVSSAIMSREGTPDFRYAAFDYMETNDLSRPFAVRLKDLERMLGSLRRPDKIVEVPHSLIFHEHYLQEYVADCVINKAFEGAMVRDPDGPYKFGRSTTREGILLKIKNFEDEEAAVVGMVEQMHNDNELQQDNLGHAKRSTAKSGLVGAGTMGALQCMFEDGTEFEVGTGFTQWQRAELWAEKLELERNGYTVAEGFAWRGAKIKHQPDPGGRKPGQKPRFPVFLGWRED